MWRKTENTCSAHYSVFSLTDRDNGMAQLRATFPEAKADEMNFVLFSTSGVHGTYNTIEEAERHLACGGEDTSGEVTFLIVHPRLVSLRYGQCEPKNQADIDYLKRLRNSSHAAVAIIGSPTEPPKEEA